jgi:adenylate cyclase
VDTETEEPIELPPDDREWRDILTGNSSLWTFGRRAFRILPSSPRCKLCSAPFHGPGGAVLRLFGKVPYAKNPSICNSCFTYISQHHGGAEVPVSLLFADVRGSTSLAEGMTPTEFTKLLNRFYAVGTDVLVNAGAIVDKFVGDEVVGVFIQGTAGPAYARKAVEAGLALLRATGNHGTQAAWVPIGAGIQTGNAYVGTVGAPGQVTDFTALGDTVNTAARLASAAGAGELLVTLDAMADAQTAGFSKSGSPERRDLALKGKHEQVPVVVLRSA